jgi:hypothetical protein
MKFKVLIILLLFSSTVDAETQFWKQVSVGDRWQGIHVPQFQVRSNSDLEHVSTLYRYEIFKDRRWGRYVLGSSYFDNKQKNNEFRLNQGLLFDVLSFKNRYMLEQRFFKNERLILRQRLRSDMREQINQTNYGGYTEVFYSHDGQSFNEIRTGVNFSTPVLQIINITLELSRLFLKNEKDMHVVTLDMSVDY